MTTQFHPHLCFTTECRDAMTHHHAVFGGDLEFTTFGDIGMDGDPDKVLGIAEDPRGTRPDRRRRHSGLPRGHGPLHLDQRRRRGDAACLVRRAGPRR